MSVDDCWKLSDQKPSQISKVTAEPSQINKAFLVYISVFLVPEHSRYVSNSSNLSKPIFHVLAQFQVFLLLLARLYLSCSKLPGYGSDLQYSRFVSFSRVVRCRNNAYYMAAVLFQVYDNYTRFILLDMKVRVFFSWIYLVLYWKHSYTWLNEPVPIIVLTMHCLKLN